MEPSIDALLDRAIDAINRGDRATATELAEQVLAVDRANADAEDLLAAPTSGGEIRRLTIFFADLVDSTVLSTRIEPETYRTVVGRYREHVLSIVERYEGHIGSTKGDGLLAVFGHPIAHENDVRRAVQAGLEITRAVAVLSGQTQRRFGFSVDVRVGVHRGVVYLDTTQDDVYGLAANYAARVSGLAPPGSVVVSGAIEPLLRRDYDLEALPARNVKGIEEPVEHHRVIAERPARPRVAPGPLVGRRRELGRFRQLWHDVLDGTATSSGIALLGEPGLGKSRLATAAAGIVEQDGGNVVALFGSPFHTEAGLYPVRTLLERRCGIGRATDGDERLRLLQAELRGLGMDPDEYVPLLAPVLGLSDDAGYERASSDGRKLYERISASVRTYLRACLGPTPGLILAEDLHWFDPSTLEVIAGMLAEPARTLVLLTSRDGKRLPEGVESIPLEPLTADETDILITCVEPELSRADREEVRRRCDGVPLYIEEVVAELSARGDLSTGGSIGPWERVPDALYEPLFAQLRSSDNAVQVVVAAATIGREVDRSTLLSVSALHPDKLDAVITELERTRVFEPVGPAAWRFRHELLREVAAELPPPSQRKLLHGRIADVIAALPGARADWRELALHYGHAERFEEAADACRHASNDARRRGALGEARTYLTYCLGHLEHLRPGRQRDRKEIAARLRRGFLTSAAEGTTSPDAAADFERCLELSGSSPNRDMFATLTALYSYYLTRCDLRRADHLLKSVRSLAGDARGWLGPVNDSGIGQLDWFRGDFDAARARLEDCAASDSLVTGDELEHTWFMPHEPIAGIHTNLALARFVHGDVAGTEAAMRSVERRCEQLTFPHGPFTLSYARTLEAWIALEAGDFDCANLILDDLVASAERHGFDGWLLIAMAQRAATATLAAVADGADSATLREQLGTLRGAVDILRAVHLVTFLTVFEAVAARAWLAAGEPERARERIEAALAQADETGLNFYRAELLRLRAATHDGATAREADLVAAADLAARQNATIFGLRVAVDWHAVDPDSGRARLAAAIAAFPEGSVWPELARARTLLE